MSSWKSEIRGFLGRKRRHVFERLGSSRFSRPGLNGLDRRIERWVDFDQGCFIEAGANDGFSQSNTYYLARFRGWGGLLIEPVPALFKRCVRTRPESTVVQAALVDFAYAEETVGIHPAGLMSMTAGSWTDAATLAHRLEMARELQNMDVEALIRVPAKPLSQIIDEAKLGRSIDLLCLDVEGAETTALQGLDLDRHTPQFICVECRDQPTVAAVLGDRYEIVEILTEAGDYQDVLFRYRS